MKNVLTERKVEKNKNVEFKGEVRGSLLERIIMYIFCTPKTFTLTNAELITNINDGVVYHTINSDGSLTLVDVVNSKKPYVRSLANDGQSDNLDALPIYS